MSYTDKLQQIDELQLAINAHGKLPDDVLKKINYKFRLEWNYTSNSMEGNTLTKRETRTVMVGLAVNEKPIKDVMEMRGHDNVINSIIKLGTGELNISEKRIKEIHEAIMYEEDPEKLKQIGKWKSGDNYIINYRGERSDFTPFGEVPEQMHKLSDWLGAEKDKIKGNKKDALHPAILAFKFHLEYVNIHPFYDGNGRTGRILLNMILISSGLPPLYIKEDEKQLYYQYLTDIQADGGAPDLYYEFMSGLLLRSQQIVLDAIEGKNIEESSDIDKEIQLLSSNLLGNNKISKTPKIVHQLFRFYNEDIWPQILATCKKFDALFGESKVVHYVNQYKEDTSVVTNILLPFQKVTHPGKIKIFGVDIYEDDIEHLEWRQIKYGLIGGKGNIKYKISLQLNFKTDEYQIRTVVNNGSYPALAKEVSSFTKHYDSYLTSDELEEMTHQLKKHLLSLIKSDTEGE